MSARAAEAKRHERRKTVHAGLATIAEALTALTGVEFEANRGTLKMTNSIHTLEGVSELLKRVTALVDAK